MMTLKHVLVPTDFSKASETALNYGWTLAGRFDATLHVLHAVENVCLSTFGAEHYTPFATGLQEMLEGDARHRLHELLVGADRIGPPIEPVVFTACSPALAIVDYAKQHEIDVIVMGTHGRGALAHLVMGSVAERVVRLAPCPVLTVKQPEHDFVRTEPLVASARANTRNRGGVGRVAPPR